MSELDGDAFRRPLVSVLIPSYNHENYIANAIESVLSQTYENLELIIVDDGSTDGSRDVIQKYSDDPRVTTILYPENRGQSFAFNQALKIARGEFISLLPSDDWYLPNKTELQVEKFLDSAEDVGLVYAAGLRYFEDTDETLPVDLPVHTGWTAETLILQGNFVYPVTPMFRRSVFDHVKPSDEFKAEGEAIYIRIAFKYRFEYVDEIVAVMRDHTYNIGKDVDIMYDELIRFWNWIFDLPEMPPELRIHRRVVIAKTHRDKGMQFVGQNRDFNKGRLCLLRALKQRPSYLFHFRLVAVLLITWVPKSLSHRILNRVFPMGSVSNSS